MTRCEDCKGKGKTATTQCREGNMHGWLCPTHGKNYQAPFDTVPHEPVRVIERGAE